MKTAFHWFLAAGMLVTGSINTISTKYADDFVVEGRAGYPAHAFDHPFFQALTMFFGEFLCLLVFYAMVAQRHITNGPKVDTAKKFNPFIFALPAVCDMTATSCMYVGLTLTYASVFQMLRGSVVIFTGIMSHFWLKRRQAGFQWFGMFLVLVGTLIVGVSSIIGKHDSASAPNPMLGDIFIVAAQVVVSIQVVVEEKFISGYKVPALQVVGLEGIFGMFVLSCVLVVMYFIPDASQPTGRFEDSLDALAMISHSGGLLASNLGLIASIAFFNWFGISVTSEMSAATRMVLDSIRTIAIWAFSLIVGWQAFSILQVAGFVVLLAGSIVYNDLYRIPFYFVYPPRATDDESSKPLRSLDNEESTLE